MPKAKSYDELTTVAAGDIFPGVVDIDDTSMSPGGTTKYVTFSNLEGSVTHNNLASIQGSSDGYHLSSTDYGNLSDANAQLAALHTDGSPTFADVDVPVGRGATYLVAASDAPQHVIDQADYKCDDYASDDAAIQAAIDAYGTNTWIRLSKGSFTIGSTIDLADGITLQGEGVHGTGLTMADGVNIDMFEWSPSSATNFASLRDMAVNGNKANNTGGRGIVLTRDNGSGGMDLILQNVWFDRFADYGIHHDGGHGARYRSVWVEHCDGGAIVHKAGQAHFTDCYIAENEGCTDGAVRLEGTYSIMMEGTEIYDNLGGPGLVVHACQQCNISAILRGNGEEGLLLDGTSSPNNSTRCLFNVVLHSNNQDSVGAADLHTTAYSNTCEIYVAAMPNIDISGSDHNIHGVVGADNGFYEQGRNTINGVGYQTGDPTSTGNWNATPRQGIIVIDDGGSGEYIYMNGTWYSL